MSYIMRTFACDGGGKLEEHTFELMQHREDGPPGFCPMCGAKVGNVVPLPAKVSIGGKAITKAVDQTYRAIEASSAERAELAGNPAIKVTNMKDHLREGDVAAILPNNSVTQWMDTAARAGASYGFGGGAMSGVSFDSSPTPVPQNTWTGPGHAALAGIQGAAGQSHQQMKTAMSVAGQMNGKPR